MKASLVFLFAACALLTSAYEFQEPKSLLVTGGAGFIGSNFINFIYKHWENAKIVNYDRMSPGSSALNIDPELRNNASRYTLVVAKVENTTVFDAVLRQHKIDFIIHFAAITHIDLSYEDRIGTIQDNVLSTTQLLEAITLRGYKGVKRLVHISTDEVYGDSLEGEAAKTEKDLPDPTNPYAASKAACEQVLRAYYHSYKLPYVMVRMNNVYGPRQDVSKLIPKFTTLAINQQPYTLKGDGFHKRSWMYVFDCADAIKRVAEQGLFGETYNIGIDFEMTIRELTYHIHNIVNHMLHRPASEPVFVSAPDRPYHDRRYFIDFSKVNRVTGWRATTPFQAGLNATVSYYVEQHKMMTNFLSAEIEPQVEETVFRGIVEERVEKLLDEL